MRTRTKIICTIGPAVNELDKIFELIEAGMDVARINFSHGSHSEHGETIKKLKIAREKCGRPLAILLDTKGPEIRVAKVYNDEIEVKENDHFFIVREWKNKNDIAVVPFDAFSTVQEGMTILIDDGYIISRVIKKEAHRFEIEVKNAGVIKSRKGVNIPEAEVNLPPLTENDVEDLKFGCKNGVDLIAASFIRSAENVLAIKKLLLEEGCPDIPVLAKIENMQGVANFDSILEVADGIMVARGDLGVEVNLGLVPKLQKMMIKKCYRAYKPVVTATQMLESMIHNPRPTRAEVSDVANAIYDSSTAVMLSGETAVGKYPVQVVGHMKNIIKHTEEDFDYVGFFNHSARTDFNDISTSVAIAAVKTAYSAGAKAIFAYTTSGFTARLISSLRPSIPIIALSRHEKSYHQLALQWGVVPVFCNHCDSEQEAFGIMSEYAQKAGIVSFGDLVVTTAGVPFGKKGSTNMMMVGSIGNILVRGAKGYGRKVEGEVYIDFSLKSCDLQKIRKKIVVIPRADESYLPVMREALGIVLQNQQGDTVSEKFAIDVARQYDLSLVVRAENAMSILSSGEIVVLDPKRSLIYKIKD